VIDFTDNWRSENMCTSGRTSVDKCVFYVKY